MDNTGDVGKRAGSADGSLAAVQRLAVFPLSCTLVAPAREALECAQNAEHFVISVCAQITGCFDSGMAYVSLSRVRSLSGLRFQRNCPSDLDCTGCAACCCQIRTADVRTSGAVKTFYQHAAEQDSSSRRKQVPAWSREQRGRPRSVLAQLYDHTRE